MNKKEWLISFITVCISTFYSYESIIFFLLTLFLLVISGIVLGSPDDIFSSRRKNIVFTSILMGGVIGIALVLMRFNG